jgi:hypothetical protein
MGPRGVAARLLMPVLAVLLLVAAPAARPGVPTRPGDRAEAFGVLPFGEGLVTNTARLSIGEFSRGIERSRPLSFPLGLAALGNLLALAVCWSSAVKLQGSQGSPSSLHRLAGPRAPPLQLA